MSALYSHTTRATGTILTAAIYNADHENHITYGDAQYLGGWSTNATQMRTVSDPGESGTESLSASISDELERLRFAILECKQALDSSLTYWYETPVELAGQIRLPPWYIEGLELSIAASSPGYIEVATGVCRSADNTINMRVSSPLHRTVTALWVTAATGGGVGVTWAKFVPYHVFVIKTSASTFDIGFDTVLTASNILARASGTKYRRIGSANTATLAGTMRAFRQRDDEIIFTDSIFSASYLSLAPSGGQGATVVKVVGVPTGISVKAHIRGWATGVARFQFEPYGRTGGLPAGDEMIYGPTAAGAVGRAQDTHLWTSPSGDIGYSAFNAVDAPKLALQGWRDIRK